ncbi:MAG: UDP-N-acetylmuramoyl-tripeptide--D-alanyl-D-alanine ligase [Treponema sp.]
MLMSFEMLRRAVDGTLIADFSHTAGFDTVVTDSRTAVHRSLFIPLRGLQQDGHRYIEEALKNGAVCILADTEYLRTKQAYIAALCKQYQAVCISVEHTLTALQNAAAAYLEQFPNLLKIGVTGSNGKTTTKELLASIFSQSYNTIKNEGNLNSETGLPLSVFTVRKEHEAGIFELGMNRKGEIAELAAVLKPQIAVITNIGTAHIGILGSKDAIAEEKKQIFSCFTQESAGFVPESDEYAAFLKDVPHGKISGYGTAAFTAEGLLGSALRYKNETITLPLPGIHNVCNASAALAVAEYCRIPVRQIKAGIEQVQPLFGRSQIIRGSVTYVLDCYNANPDSMQAGLSLCEDIPVKGRKVYILASMRELGAESVRAHQAVCTAAFASGADALFFFGEEMCTAGTEQGRHSNKSFFCFQETEADQLAEALDSFLKNGDFVFLKGSRSLALEQFEPVLQKERPL